MSLNKLIRQFSRIPFDAETCLYDTDKKHSWPCQLIDISLNGALVSPPADWSAKTGDSYKLELKLSDELCLRMDVRVAHIKDDHVGLQVELMDVDTASHLHRLIELNTGDSKELDRELAELIDQHMA